MTTTETPISVSTYEIQGLCRQLGSAVETLRDKARAMARISERTLQSLDAGLHIGGLDSQTPSDYARAHAVVEALTQAIAGMSGDETDRQALVAIYVDPKVAWKITVKS